MMEIHPYYTLSSFEHEVSVKKRDTTLLLIALVVFFIHLLGVAFGMISSSTPIKKPLKQNVVVKTVQLNPRLEPISTPAEKPVVIVQPAPILPSENVIEKIPVNETPPPPPPAVKEPPPKPIEKPKATPPPPPPKKVEPKKADPKPAPAPPKTVKPEVKKTSVPAKKPVPPAPVKKAEVPPPKPPPKAPEIDKKALEAERVKQQAIATAEETARQKQQQLLSKAKESLAKMGETRDKVLSNPSLNLADASIPQRIQNLQIDALPAVAGVVFSTSEIKYQYGLASRLKNDLILPDYGTVKVKLTLTKAGKVTQIEVTSSSEKNKKYIEKTLPTLTFPPFGTQFDGAEQYTFMLTLHNDE